MFVAGPSCWLVHCWSSFFCGTSLARWAPKNEEKGKATKSLKCFRFWTIKIVVEKKGTSAVRSIFEKSKLTFANLVWHFDQYVHIYIYFYTRDIICFSSSTSIFFSAQLLIGVLPFFPRLWSAFVCDRCIYCSVTASNYPEFRYGLSCVMHPVCNSAEMFVILVFHRTGHQSVQTEDTPACNSFHAPNLSPCGYIRTAV